MYQESVRQNTSLKNNPIAIYWSDFFVLFCFYNKKIKAMMQVIAPDLGLNTF